MGDETTPPRLATPAGVAEPLAEQLRRGCQALAARPLTLFLLLCAVNAVVRPYANIDHDATLYAAQVLNRAEPGCFDRDLFFLYGSQDNYSLFSTMTAPLVRAVGVRTAFFLLYLMFNGLLLFALQRLVLALFADRVLAVLALFCLAVIRTPYGGQEVFHVTEEFTTPRLLAVALVLLGLERLLAGRTVSAALLLAAAMATHPLMAFPGVLAAVGWWALTYLPPRVWITAAAALGLLAAGTLVYPPVAVRLFGEMTPDWLDAFERANAYNFPHAWSSLDWLRIVLAVALALTASVGLRNDGAAGQRAATLFLVFAVLGVVGVVGMVVVVALPYALPIQGQPYRALWLLQLWAVPLTLWLCGRLWRRGETASRLLAVVLLTNLGSGGFDPASRVTLVVAAVAGVGVCWRPLGLAFTAVAARAGWLIQLPVGTLTSSSVGVAALAVALAAQALSFWPQRCAAVGVAVPPGDDLHFVADFLAEQQPDVPRPVVYWPDARLDVLWADLRLNTYYGVYQLSGNVFSHRTAREGWRRGQQVKRFELARFPASERTPGTWLWRRSLRMLNADGTEGPPRSEDLVQLCRDEALDVVVLPYEFPGLVARTNGRLYLYDCRAVRAASGSPGS